MVFSPEALGSMRGAGISNKILLFTKRFNEGMNVRGEKLEILEIVKSVNLFSSGFSDIDKEMKSHKGVQKYNYEGISNGLILCSPFNHA